MEFVLDLGETSGDSSSFSTELSGRLDKIFFQITAPTWIYHAVSYITKISKLMKIILD